MGSNFSLALNYQDPCIWEGVTKLLNEYKCIRHLFAGDFHPLTPYRVSDDVWLAWQFNRSDLGEGLVQAFRRSGSGISTHQFRLHGLNPKALYEWKDVDSGRTAKMTGDALMERGLEVQVKDQPSTPRQKFVTSWMLCLNQIVA
jgi:alpha-galactosidase